MAWVTGDFDALLHVRTRDPQHLQEVVFRINRACGGGATSRTMVVLSFQFERPRASIEKTLSSWPEDLDIAQHQDHSAD
jgi:hypothetical protein